MTTKATKGDNCVRTIVVEAVRFEQVDDAKFVRHIRLGVVHSKKIPLCVTGSIEIGFQNEFVLKLTTVMIKVI